MWQQSSSGVWYPSRSPKEFLAIYINANTGQGINWGQWCFARGEWSTQNFASILPPGCKAVEFGGLLIITHVAQRENTPPDVNLMIGFRTYEPDLEKQWDWGYDGQTIEPLYNSGVRTNYTSGPVAVVDGKLDVWWDCLDMAHSQPQQIPLAGYPHAPSFGITLFARSSLT
jgi:hypothetical protein